MDIFKFGASAAASEFYEQVQVRFGVYIPHCTYPIKFLSSPWFSVAWADAITNRNNFFHLQQHNKSPESTVKFRQASNYCKRVLKGVKLTYANRTKESITFGTFDNLLIMSTKGKPAIPPLFNSPEVLTSKSDKARLFAENYSRN